MAKQSTTMTEHARTVLAHQSAQAQGAAQAAPQDGQRAAPQGRKLVRNLGTGTLYPGVGRIVQRTGLPIYCGTITALVSGVTQHPNAKDPKRISYRFAGQFLLVDHEGTVFHGAECYLPSTLQSGLLAGLNARPDGQGAIRIAGEVWCEAADGSDGRPAAPLGYGFVWYDRTPEGDNNPLMALAYEAGILTRPAAQLPAPAAADDGEVDPETGEIGPQSPQASAA